MPLSATNEMDSLLIKRLIVSQSVWSDFAVSELISKNVLILFFSCVKNFEFLSNNVMPPVCMSMGALQQLNMIYHWGVV